MEGFMKKIKYLFLFTVILFFLNYQNSYAQFWQPTPPPPNIPFYKATEFLNEGINVIIIADSFCIKWGIKLEELEDAGREAVKAAGWKYNPLSHQSILVSIDSLMKKNDSLYAFRIKSVNFFKILEIKENQTGLLYPTIEQLVYRVAMQKRNEILRANITKPDPDKEIEPKAQDDFPPVPHYREQF